jgi:hypothetical protein
MHRSVSLAMGMAILMVYSAFGEEITCPTEKDATCKIIAPPYTKRCEREECKIVHVVRNGQEICIWRKATTLTIDDLESMVKDLKAGNIRELEK